MEWRWALGRGSRRELLEALRYGLRHSTAKTERPSTVHCAKCTIFTQLWSALTDVEKLEKPLIRSRTNLLTAHSPHYTVAQNQDERAATTDGENYTHYGLRRPGGEAHHANGDTEHLPIHHYSSR